MLLSFLDDLNIFSFKMISIDIFFHCQDNNARLWRLGRGAFDWMWGGEQTFTTGESRGKREAFLWLRGLDQLEEDCFCVILFVDAKKHILLIWCRSTSIVDGDPSTTLVATFFLGGANWGPKKLAEEQHRETRRDNISWKQSLLMLHDIGCLALIQIQTHAA